MKKKKSLIFLALMFFVLAGFSVNKNEFKSGYISDDKPIEIAEVYLSNENSSSKSKKVGIILPTKNQQRWVSDEEKFIEIIEARGIDAQIKYSDENIKIEAQNVQKFIRDGVNILIICSSDTKESGAIVEKAKKAGMKVIAYDREIENTTGVDYFVTFDSVDVGVEQGDYLVSQAGDETSLPLYLYGGSEDDINSFKIFEGTWQSIQPKIADGTFIVANSKVADSYKEKNILTKDEQIEIISDISIDWDVEKAKNKAENDLENAESNLKGDVFVLAPNDQSSRVIFDVFNKDSEVDDIVITGQDAEMESIQSIIDGKQSMTVVKDTRILSGKAIDIAVDLIGNKTPDISDVSNNGTLEVPTVNVDVTLVTEENLKTTIFDTGIFTISDFKKTNK